MQWLDVCNDPLLRDLPYKIELNEWGKIVMSPASTLHVLLQSVIHDTLRRATSDGLILPECPIQTTKGVRVANVAWASSDFLKAHGRENPFFMSPELCIEVISASNSVREMDEKRELYFECGAKEVWLCDERGQLSFYNGFGSLTASCLFPAVRKIEVDCLH
jgi:Uma2 family endonuclease